MIKERTVFVLGAGASMPYKFPSGPELLRRARDRSSEGIHKATNGRFEMRLVREFREAMKNSQSDSIDSMLEYRNDLQEIGSYFIAAEILHAEFSSLSQRPDSGDWISYLFRQIDAGDFQAFCDCPVTFVTYNYDRLVEQRFNCGLVSKFQPTSEQLARYWTDRPVIHLHGSVGDLSKDAPGFVPFGAAIRVSGEVEECIPRYLDAAAKGIRIVHQAEPNSAAFQSARMALREASHVYFLGFSFGRANVDRLGLEAMGEASCGCTRVNMTESECAVQILAPFKKLLDRHPSLGAPEDDCERFLRKHVAEFVQRY
jgi:hypothetical protein